MGPHQSRVKGDNHLPLPAGRSSLNAAQDTVGLLGCKCTLLAYVQLFVHQDPRVLCRAAPKGFYAQFVQASGFPLHQGHQQWG